MTEIIFILAGIFIPIFMLVVAAVLEHEDKARRKKSDHMDDFLESLKADTLEPDYFEARGGGTKCITFSFAAKRN